MIAKTIATARDAEKYADAGTRDEEFRSRVELVRRDEGFHEIVVVSTRRWLELFMEHFSTVGYMIKVFTQLSEEEDIVRVRLSIRKRVRVRYPSRKANL